MVNKEENLIFMCSASVNFNLPCRRNLITARELQLWVLQLLWLDRTVSLLILRIFVFVFFNFSISKWKISLLIVFTFNCYYIPAESCDLYTWGDGTKSKLGHGEETEEQKPRIVDALSRLNIKLVACGAKYMLCVTGKLNSIICTTCVAV